MVIYSNQVQLEKWLKSWEKFMVWSPQECLEAPLIKYLEYQLGFKQCYADNDVWMRPSRNKKGNKVFYYICIYVDDIPKCSANPQLLVDQNVHSVHCDIFYIRTSKKLNKYYLKLSELHTQAWIFSMIPPATAT